MDKAKQPPLQTPDRMSRDEQSTMSSFLNTRGSSHQTLNNKQGVHEYAISMKGNSPYLNQDFSG